MWYLVVSIPDLCTLTYFILPFLKIVKFLIDQLEGIRDGGGKKTDGSNSLKVAFLILVDLKTTI